MNRSRTKNINRWAWLVDLGALCGHMISMGISVDSLLKVGMSSVPGPERLIPSMNAEYCGP